MSDDIYFSSVPEAVGRGLSPLMRDLVEIGRRAGVESRAEGDSIGEAVWRAVPNHAEVMGPVWEAIHHGVRAAYGLSP
jgi:hypothetical protein